MQNDVPSTYFSHLDNNGQRRDRDQRPELARCSVEFVAPADYMVHTSHCACVVQSRVFV
jgi:protein transport protein SEC24